LFARLMAVWIGHRFPHLNRGDDAAIGNNAWL
jgi:hypothetical protein